MMRLILVFMCSIVFVTLGDHPNANLQSHEQHEPFELYSTDSYAAAAAAPVARTVIPSRQTSSPVIFGDRDNKETDHYHNNFQEQRFQEFVPQPYDFGYSIQDEYGNNQYRQETADQHGAVQGSYGYTDAFGIYRKVKYIADKDGFRAEVSSNEPGVKGENPASASFIVETSPQTSHL